MASTDKVIITEGQLSTLMANIKQGMTLTGTSDPTTATVGKVGQIYLNIATGKLFVMTGIVEESGQPDAYTWATASGEESGIFQVKQVPSTNNFDHTANEILAAYNDGKLVTFSFTFNNKHYTTIYGGEINSGYLNTYVFGFSPYGGTSYYLLRFNVYNSGDNVATVPTACGNVIEPTPVSDTTQAGWSSDTKVVGAQSLKSVIGAKSNLTTTNTSSLVAAVNEVNGKFVNGGTTAPTTSTVGSVGSLYSYVDTTGTTPEPHLLTCTAVATDTSVTPNVTTYTWTDLLGSVTQILHQINNGSNQ